MQEMKRLLTHLALAGLLLVGGCSATPQSAEEKEESQETSEELGSPTTTSDMYYRPVIRDGIYQKSKSRGLTPRLNSTVNLKSFEKGLMILANEHYPNSDYFFEEGQYLTSDQVEGWLERHGPDHPNGLNPPENDGENSDERTPIYLESILEQDYYMQTENGLEIDGVMIGLAMNSVDYYQTEQYGPTYTQEIDREAMLEQARDMIPPILQALREHDDLKDMPIYFAVFEQAPKDDVGGGVYVAQTVSTQGTAIENLDDLNHSKMVLPLEGDQTSLGNNFASFQDEIKNFFPNLAGETGVAVFDGDKLKNLRIDITTQFYGEGEIIAFTQYVEAAAMNYLPTNVPVEITIDSMDDTEAFLYTDGDSKEYFSHIFD